MYESDFRRVGLYETLQQLRVEGRAPDANVIVATLEKLLLRNPFRARRGPWYWILPLLALGFVVLWESAYAIWSDKSGAHEVVLLFAFLEIGAIAGASLRLLTQVMVGDRHDIDLALVANSFSISLVLAWGLGLAYFAVGQDVSASDQSPVLTVAHLGIRMGLIGLVAGCGRRFKKIP